MVFDLQKKIGMAGHIFFLFRALELYMFSSFGLDHDSGDCAKGYIVHAALSSGKNAFSWSSCSRDKLQALFSDR